MSDSEDTYPPPWMWVPSDEENSIVHPQFYGINDVIKDSYNLWFYWRNNVYIENGDPIKENIYIHPYFTDILDDDYKEIQKCFSDLKDSKLTNEIYYEYRLTNVYGTPDGWELLNINVHTQYTAQALNLDIGIDVFENNELGRSRFNPYQHCKTKKAIEKQRRKYQKDFEESINAFVISYVYKRKLEVTIMNDYKKRLWNNGGLQKELEAAIAARITLGERKRHLLYNPLSKTPFYHQNRLLVS
jgi:hypothetical protein